MKLGHSGIPDDAVRSVSQTMSGTRGEDYEDLDAGARVAIEEAEAQYQRGEGRPWAEVRAEVLARFVKK